jgi:uncharacterized protein
MNMEPRLLKSLLLPEAYQEPAGTVSFLQTHISYIFLTDHHVYKIKKPVDFGFLNFSTVDRRRFYCNEEVRLNRRLCPEIYLGVVEVRESTSGAAFYGEGKVIDYAVKMKRLPEERMLDRMLAEGKLTATDFRYIARVIARFHLAAERGGTIDEFGRIEAIRRNWEENFQQAREFVNISLAKRDLNVIRNWIATFLSDNEALFAERVARGFIRDCDGDIHLENICLTDRACIFDCIEFNDRFRYTDTAADIAFLLMDVDYHGRTDFSDVFLEEYITVTEDREVVRVLDFYKTYRAFVRGKVESLKLHDPDIPEAEKQSANYKARRYFRLARRYAVRHRLPPALVITCGLTGSGKSAIAAALASELGVEAISADVVRKTISATPLHHHRMDEYGSGIYTPAFNAATYEELFQRSETALKAGRGVIVDATFRRREDRDRFRGLADRVAVPFYIVHTTCPDELTRKRLDNRGSNPGEVSDGRWELLSRQKGEFEPPAKDEGNLIRLDTARPINDSLDDILGAMEILQ